MITKLARLEFELFTKPSNFDFIRVHQFYIIESGVFPKNILAVTKTRNLKNTKISMGFFVISAFRDFVIKDVIPVYPGREV